MKRQRSVCEASWGLVRIAFMLTIAACTNLEDGDGDGYTPAQGDCDDTNPRAHPGATEIRADHIDENCNGDGDEDLDGDGYFSNGESEAIDCDDTNSHTFPGAPEYEDGADQNCNGIIDDQTGSHDDDGDGITEVQGDCDDLAPTIYPGAPEILDGRDNDCNGVTDEGTTAFDDDGDTFTEADGDCDDGNPAVYPGAPESGKTGGKGGDGVDNNCNGLVDEGTWSCDDDGDGFSEDGTVGGASDCDDTDPGIHPGAVEVPSDGIDNNCDGVYD